MTRERFAQLVAQALDSLPAKFRTKIQNVAVVVEDLPPGQPAVAGQLAIAGRPESAEEEDLLMGIFEGVPATEKSVWDTSVGPDRIVLYQKNIEAVCETSDEVREEVRLTVLHELGHYFGLSEDELEEI